MMFFLHAAALNLKRRLRKPGTLFLAILLLLLTGGVSLFLAGDSDMLQIRAAVAFAPDDAFGAGIFDRLGQFDSPIIFERYGLDARPFLEEAVATGELECAFILSPELEQSIVYGRASGGIVLLVSPRSVAHPLADGMVHAAVLGEKAPAMTAELLEEVLGASPEIAAEIAAERFAHYSGEDIFLEPEFVYQNGRASENAAAVPVGSRPLHGIIALLLMAGILWAIPALTDESPALLRRMPGVTARVYCFAVAASLGFVCFLTGLVSLLAIYIIYPAALGSALTELGWLAAYCLSLGLAGAAVPLALRRADAVYGGGIFLLMLTAVLGGIFFDLGELGSVPAALSRIFPTAGYIGGALGGAAAFGSSILVAMGLGTALILVRAGHAQK